MNMMNKINIIKSYGITDLIDKFLNFPRKIVYKKNKKIFLKKLYNDMMNCELPTLSDYEKRKDNRIIISLTSFPKRFEQLVITLKSIILQDITPSKIIVYLGSDTCENDITYDMKSLEKYGVEYRIDKKMNLKGHKKYFYALREFPQNLIITIDDDIFFPNTMISELIECYEKNPTAVCARRVHKITKKRKKILSYNLWDKEYTKKCAPSNRMFATTGAGTLYSPYVISHMVDYTFDSNKIIKLCLEADDVWMKCMEILSSIKVALADVVVMGAFIDVDEKYTLMPDNVGNGKNDVFLNKVIKSYDINMDLFIND